MIAAPLAAVPGETRAAEACGAGEPTFADPAGRVRIARRSSGDRRLPRVRAGGTVYDGAGVTLDDARRAAILDDPSGRVFVRFPPPKDHAAASEPAFRRLIEAPFGS